LSLHFSPYKTIAIREASDIVISVSQPRIF
jgi:hypothetical protein